MNRKKRKVTLTVTISKETYNRLAKIQRGLRSLFVERAINEALHKLGDDESALVGYALRLDTQKKKREQISTKSRKEIDQKEVEKKFLNSLPKEEDFFID